MADRMPPIEATIQEVQHNPTTGWFDVITDQGKFSTKVTELASDAVAHRGQRVLIDYAEEVVTKPAPDGSGMRTYRNRYFNGAGTAPPAQDGFTTVGQPQQPQAPPPGVIEKTGGEDPRRSWRICLQTGGKLAVQTLPLMPAEQQTFEVQKQIALAWAKFFYFTQLPMEPMGTDMPVPTFAGMDTAGYAQPPPPSDRDIPF